MSLENKWEPSMGLDKWEASLINFPPMHHEKLQKPLDTIVTQQKIVETLLYPDPQNSSITAPSVPEDCPKGLERLSQSRTLIVIRRPENSINLFPEHRLLAFAQYDIVSSEGRQLYVAVEQTNYKSIFWTRDARIFNVTLYDNKCKKILTIKRPWTCRFCFAQYYCFFCTLGFQGCGNEAIITLNDDGQRLGHIIQKFSCQQTQLDIYDEKKSHVMSIYGKLSDGIFDIVFPDEEDEPIAMIETSMTPREVSDFYKITVSSYEDPYGITFFAAEINEKYKALIISAVILMDYIFCKPSGDYPHWTQFVPLDFKPDSETHTKTFKDGSKEILVTSMKPKALEDNGIIRPRKTCGCCRWFFGFICLCCPLGMVRNAVRCSQLIFFGLLIVILGCLGIYFWKFS